MSRRAWRRTTALILGWTSFMTLAYSGLLPAPVLDDVVWMVAGFGLKPFWVVVAAGELTVAIGVTRRHPWARVIAILFGAWLLVTGVSGLFAGIWRGAPIPFSLVDVAMGLLVLYGVGARWSRRPAPLDPEATLRRKSHTGLPGDDPPSEPRAPASAGTAPRP